MAIPIEKIGPRDMLIALLSIPQTVCDYFITGGLLDSHRIVNFLYHYEDRPSYCAMHTVTTMICRVSDMLLVTRFTRVDPTIMILIYHTRNRESIVSIVLSKTMNGLDAYHHRSSTFLRGSPRLQYMWLLERFRSVGFNSVRLDNPTHFFHCPIFSSLTMSYSAFVVWFSENFIPIRWHISWWKFRSIVVGFGCIIAYVCFNC